MCFYYLNYCYIVFTKFALISSYLYAVLSSLYLKSSVLIINPNQHFLAENIHSVQHYERQCLLYSSQTLCIY